MNSATQARCNAIASRLQAKFPGASPFGPIIQALIQMLLSMLSGCGLAGRGAARVIKRPRLFAPSIMREINNTDGTEGYESDILREVIVESDSMSADDAIAFVS